MIYQEISANKRNSVFLMMAVIALVCALGYIFSAAQGDTTYGGVWIAVIISFGMTAISYFQGDKIALWTSGARPLEHDENKYVYHLVENLCITSGLPMPKIYIMPDPAINAFATGRKPEMSSIALTTGAIEKLTNEELEGVIAHELSHVKNYDIRFMMLVAVMVGSISILSNIFLRSRFMFGGRSRDNNNGNIGAILTIVGVILAILSPLIAELIKLAVSRQREYLADASGALLTRYPAGLASALQKIAADGQPMARASTATAHLFISNPFGPGKKFSSLFSTHPPVEERIKRLRAMS